MDGAAVDVVGAAVGEAVGVDVVGVAVGEAVGVDVVGVAGVGARVGVVVAGGWGMTWARSSSTNSIASHERMRGGAWRD